jgi:hypothetical protein
MPIMQQGVAAMSGRMPKILSPKQHAIADYIALGGLLLMTAALWKRHKRAAIGSLVCAGAEATNTLLTDSPGGVAKVIGFHTHGKIDMGLAAICSAIPNFFGFEDDAEAKYFRMMGLNITAVAALTDFGTPPQSRNARSRQARTA